MNTTPTLAEAVSCLSDYDPQALRVSDAQRVIEHFVTPVAAVERVAIRESLDRILALDVVSTIDVPAHDNSAMDGFALRGADLLDQAESRLHGRRDARSPANRSHAASAPARRSGS